MLTLTTGSVFITPRRVNHIWMAPVFLAPVFRCQPYLDGPGVPVFSRPGVFSAEIPELTESTSHHHQTRRRILAVRVPDDDESDTAASHPSSPDRVDGGRDSRARPSLHGFSLSRFGFPPYDQIDHVSAGWFSLPEKTSRLVATLCATGGVTSASTDQVSQHAFPMLNLWRRHDSTDGKTKVLAGRRDLPGQAIATTRLRHRQSKLTPSAPQHRQIPSEQ